MATVGRFDKAGKILLEIVYAKVSSQHIEFAGCYDHESSH